MSKLCARCEKTVYPTEEWKCLDKLWHKQCFKCHACNMTLNIRNYKGFNKIPYCEAHIPKAKATTVAETPETKRIAENTKLQSNVKYHAEFEKAKGKHTQVADDPETLRIKQNSQIISNAAYHGDHKRKAEMEQKRTLTGGNENSGVPRQGYDTSGAMAIGNHSDYKQPPPPFAVGTPKMSSTSAQYNASILTEIKKSTPQSARQSSTLIYTSNQGPVNVNMGRSVGSIADLDPVNDFYGSLTNSYSRHHHAPISMNNNNAKRNVAKSGNMYRAMYDYEAQESDEVSFVDGDIIANCVHIHEGWMSGVVQRTGQCGLLPANYVESIVI